MDITLISKARFDALMQDIKNLEAQIQMAHTQLKAMQETNNNFADIAFDENRFTDELLSRCEEVAREAAKEEIDTDDIADEAARKVDLSDAIDEYISNDTSILTKDYLEDKISEYISDNNILDSNEVEDVVSDYIQHNCDFVEKDDLDSAIEEKVEEELDSLIGNYDFAETCVTNDLHDQIQELKREVQSMKEGIAHEVLQLIANKLTERKEALLPPPVESNGHDQLSQ